MLRETVRDLDVQAIHAFSLRRLELVIEAATAEPAMVRGRVCAEDLGSIARDSPQLGSNQASVEAVEGASCEIAKAALVLFGSC